MTQITIEQRKINQRTIKQITTFFNTTQLKRKKTEYAYIIAGLYLKNGETKEYAEWLETACELGSLNAIYDKATHLYKNEYGYMNNDSEVLSLLKGYLDQVYYMDNIFSETVDRTKNVFPRLQSEINKLANATHTQPITQQDTFKIQPVAQDKVKSSPKNLATNLGTIEVPRKFKSENAFAPVTQVQDSSFVHCHTIREVKKINKPKDSAVWIQKFPHDNQAGQKAIIQIEAFASQVYRAMMINNTPKNRATLNERGQISSVISKKIANFTTLADFKPKRNAVDIESIARGVASAYVFEENDFRDVNCGFRVVRGKKAEFIKIDHDQSFWSIVSERNGNFENYAIPIDISNLRNLLQLKTPTGNPRNWIDLTKIINTPKKLAQYQAGLYKYWLKSILLDENFFKVAVNAHISDSQLKKQIITHTNNRRKQLQLSLLKMPEFRTYLLKNPQVIQEIAIEFDTYNKMIAKEKDSADKTKVFATEKHMVRLVLDTIKLELKYKYQALSNEQLSSYSDHIYQSFNILKHRQLAKEMTLNDYLAKLSPHLIHQICQNQPNNSEFQGQAIAKHLTEMVVLEHLTAELNKFSKRGLLQRLGDFFRGGSEKIKTLQKTLLSNEELQIKLQAIKNYNEEPIAAHSLNETLKSSYKVIDVVESSSKACNGKTQTKTTAKETQGSHINLKQTNISNNYLSPMTIRGMRNA